MCLFVLVLFYAIIWAIYNVLIYISPAIGQWSPATDQIPGKDDPYLSNIECRIPRVLTTVRRVPKIVGIIWSSIDSCTDGNRFSVDVCVSFIMPENRETIADLPKYHALFCLALPLSFSLSG